MKSSIRKPILFILICGFICLFLVAIGVFLYHYFNIDKVLVIKIVVFSQLLVLLDMLFNKEE